MKFNFDHRAVVFLCLLVATCFSSCKCNIETPQPLDYNYMNVPEGDTAILESLNISGMGARKNNKNTTWIIRGNVVMDHLDVRGNIVVDRGRLTVLGVLNVKETGVLIVNSELKYSELKQSGKIHYNTPTMEE